jgi:hypothetical protein
MKDYPKLTPAEVMHLDSGICPDCGSPRFLEGPHGGMNVNIQCANEKCQSEFNIVPGLEGSFGKERISEKSPARQKILDAVFTPLA